MAGSENDPYVSSKNPWDKAPPPLWRPCLKTGA